jgi:hypothetical protein
MSSKQGTSGSGGGGGQDRGQNVTHQDMAEEQRRQREARKQKQIKEGQALVTKNIESDRRKYSGKTKQYLLGDPKAVGEMYGGRASQMTNEYLVSIGEAKRGNPYYDHKGKITGYSYMITAQGKEMKYGKSGGAMGSGDPTGIMSSTAISRTMWDAQKDVQQLMKLGPMGLMMSASKANEASYNKYLNSFYNQQSSTSIAYNTNAGNISNGENQNAITGESVLDKSFSDTLADASEKNKLTRLAAVTGATGGERDERKFLQASRRVFGGGMATT